MERTVIVKNELIADFMGYERDKWKYFIPEHGYISTDGLWKDMFSSEHLKYHKSWAWVMPVLQRIESIDYDTLISNFQVTVSTDSKNISNVFIGDAENAVETKLQAVYKVVVEFIEWYNRKQSENGD